MRSLHSLLFAFILIEPLWAGQVPIVGDKDAPIVYMIRHAEKPPKTADGQDRPGLSAEGTSRAEHLVQTFSKTSKYNISYIMVQHPKKDGHRSRPYQTVEPLATSLGVKIHSKIDRDDAAGAAATIKNYVAKNKGNILVCWEHSQMRDIAAALGITRYSDQSGWTGPIEYPHGRFDLIWVVPTPYTQIATVESQKVPDLDDGNSPIPPENSARQSKSLPMALMTIVVAHFMYKLSFSII
ncbi:hypothetical protein BT63DRAFT_294535 [Microthyrium microscopicum]|uniref:Phosphoglycerate mutase family protein n=1 Tax=Microthyrium microscopicum TaxID=703497 RepID=A0A6A6U5G8_9PEZI|nr:hypothetical protein BT63DRAFT_294535 [Microthyrium microscopicum]